jgi:endo-1,4-beta-mannosidase
VGLGADPETLFRASGVDARSALDRCEFAVSHLTAAYRAYAAEGPLTSGPSTYLDSFLLRNAHRGRPVLLDEIGVLSLDHSAAEEAAYVRTVLWSGFMNRAAGVMLRRYRDMDTERREPYFLDPFETLVGLADSAGLVKPAFGEVVRFVRTAARIDLRTHALLAERTAVMMPSERFEPLPSLAGLYGPRSCLHSYIIAKQAHVPVAVIREDDDLDEHLVLIVPSAFALSDHTWDRLAEFVQSGGTLLMSYGGGDAHSVTRDLFGVEFLGDGGPRSQFSCRVAQPDVLGDLEAFDVAFDLPNHALLSGGGATVVATDAKGSPLLTVNQVGQGRAVYVAVPLERAIAQGDPWAVPAPVSRFAREVYGAVARGAGCGAPVDCGAPHVEVALLQGESDDVLLLLNHAPEKVNASLVTERRVASITDVRGGSPVAVGGTDFAVPLEPNGAVALRITYA